MKISRGGLCVRDVTTLAPVLPPRPLLHAEWGHSGPLHLPARPTRLSGDPPTSHTDIGGWGAPVFVVIVSCGPVKSGEEAAFDSV